MSMMGEMFGSMFGSGVGDAAKVAADDPGIGAGLSSQDIADIDGASPGVAAGVSSPFLPSWAGDALGPLMKSITGAALRPGVGGAGAGAPMAPSGHGVNVNAASDGQVIGELGKAVSGDPLNGLSGFKNLL